MGIPGRPDMDGSELVKVGGGLVLRLVPSQAQVLNAPSARSSSAAFSGELHSLTPLKDYWRIVTAGHCHQLLTQ